MNTEIQNQNINNSEIISRDLSWLKFNYRVLDQAKNTTQSIFDNLKFLAISSSNLDEFFAIRVGSLYNYLDFGKERIDYSGLREEAFRDLLLSEAKDFIKAQANLFDKKFSPQFSENGFQILKFDELNKDEEKKANKYFQKIVFPMLTPMIYDTYHTFPLLRGKSLILGVVTKFQEGKKRLNKLSFIQIPNNVDSFYEFERDGKTVFLSIVEIIRANISKLYRNVDVSSVDLFRITRNGDFTLDESDDVEIDFIKEVQQKLKSRRKGRVVRLEIESGYNKWMVDVLKQQWSIGSENIMKFSSLIDYTRLWQIINHKQFKSKSQEIPKPVKPLSCPNLSHDDDIFEVLSQQDILLHHPYNSIDPIVQLLEKAAVDPKVLAIKQTIYRLADDSRITTALLKAAENGKHISVLFEVKARFDEEKNIQEAKKLEKAGCFVVYGVGAVKTHTKLLMVVRKEGNKVKRYIHLGSGNYNENTSKLYTDVSLLSSNEIYGNDVSEFFNAITGHSNPRSYDYLITAPKGLRSRMLQLIEHEIATAKSGKKAEILLKINSLEDKQVIEKLYEASQAGVTVQLIVRGICCLRPERKGLSENIKVISIVGNLLEHSRLYYFHNQGHPFVFGGSADIMVRSFDRRVESLFLIADDRLKKECIDILRYCLKDNVNAYQMFEDGSYGKISLKKGEKPFSVHEEFFKLGASPVNQEVKVS